MRAILGFAGLLVALAVVGVLVKKQLSVARPPVLQAPATATTDGAPATVREQSQQVQQQYRQVIEGAMQAPRSMPEDK